MRAHTHTHAPTEYNGVPYNTNHSSELRFQLYNQAFTIYYRFTFKCIYIYPNPGARVSVSCFPLCRNTTTHFLTTIKAIMRLRTRTAAVRHWLDLSLSTYERDLVTNEKV